MEKLPPGFRLEFQRADRFPSYVMGEYWKVLLDEDDDIPVLIAVGATEDEAAAKAWEHPRARQGTRQLTLFGGDT